VNIGQAFPRGSGMETIGDLWCKRFDFANAGLHSLGKRVGLRDLWAPLFGREELNGNRGWIDTRNSCYVACMKYWWKYYDFTWTRSWISAMNSGCVAVLLMKMMLTLLK